MDFRIYDIDGQTLGRATLGKDEKGVPYNGRDLVRRMRKGQLFFAPWEEPKKVEPPKATAGGKSPVPAAKAPVGGERS